MITLDRIPNGHTSNAAFEFSEEEIPEEFYPSGAPLNSDVNAEESLPSAGARVHPRLREKLDRQAARLAS